MPLQGLQLSQQRIERSAKSELQFVSPDYEIGHLRYLITFELTMVEHKAVCEVSDWGPKIIGVFQANEKMRAEPASCQFRLLLS
jgi:hypothetical protein